MSEYTTIAEAQEWCRQYYDRINAAMFDLQSRLIGNPELMRPLDVIDVFMKHGIALTEIDMSRLMGRTERLQ